MIAKEPDLGARDYLINSIQNATSIAVLKFKKSDAQSYKTKLLEKLIENTPTKPEITDDKGAYTAYKGGEEVNTKPKAKAKPKSAQYRVASGTNIIRTKDDLEEFLAKIRRDMTKLINEDKTIILK